MQSNDKVPTGKENTSYTGKPSYSLLYLIRAYNRGEMTLDEWLALSKEWAERIIQQHAKPEPS